MRVGYSQAEQGVLSSILCALGSVSCPLWVCLCTCGMEVVTPLTRWMLALRKECDLFAILAVSTVPRPACPQLSSASSLLCPSLPHIP